MFEPIDTPEFIAMDTGETVTPLSSFNLPDDPECAYHIVEDDGAYALACDKDGDGNHARLHRWPRGAALALASLLMPDEIADGEEVQIEDVQPEVLLPDLIAHIDAQHAAGDACHENVKAREHMHQALAWLGERNSRRETESAPQG